MFTDSVAIPCNTIESFESRSLAALNALEVTACCWLDASTLILAARDDHELHYLDVAADGLKDATVACIICS